MSSPHQLDEKSIQKNYKKVVLEIIKRHRKTADFWSTEVILPKSELDNWICMRNNPSHFSMRMFIGSWSIPNRHPIPDSIRIVRLMEMPDNTLRLIGRQGSDLYVLILN